jgi:hypothetical protein
VTDLGTGVVKNYLSLYPATYVSTVITTTYTGVTVQLYSPYVVDKTYEKSLSSLRTDGQRYPRLIGR